MATNFPSSLDTSTQQPTISSTDEMDDSGKEHDVVHTNHSGALIALETKLGTGDSNATANAVLIGTGSGTSGWDTSPTFKGAVTVGVDDTGHDVKFFGATAGKYMEWDESEDDLNIAGALKVRGDSYSTITNNGSSGREILQIRAKSANSDGAGLNMYGGGDSSNAGKTIFYNNDATSMKIDGDGIMTAPEVPAFRVSNTTGGGGYLHNGSSAGAGVIIFGTDSGTGLYDNGNNYNTSTGIFTAPVTGYYFFSITIFKHTAYDNDDNCYWGFNSSNGEVKSNHGLKGYDGGGTVTALFYLDAGDTCSGFNWSAADIYSWRTQEYNAFQGILIG